jgi:hypothetical protein
VVANTEFKIAKFVFEKEAECQYAGKIDLFSQNELIDALHSVFQTTDGLFSATIDATNVKDGFLIDFTWDSGATTAIVVSNDE